MSLAMTDPADAPTVPRWKAVAATRRGLLILLVLVQTLGGLYGMQSVLPYHGGNLLEKGILFLFAVLFAWISVGFWTAVLGFWKK